MFFYLCRVQTWLKHPLPRRGPDTKETDRLFMRRSVIFIPAYFFFLAVTNAAAQAFALRKGVCQDFSHILISMLRVDVIAARYIDGLAFCDGETHSWVEYWTGYHWEGIDPANNCSVSDDYLVISQGRDFRECAIDRGVMMGRYTRQLQLVRSVLT